VFKQVRAAVRRLNLEFVYAGDRAIYPWTSRSPGFLNLNTVADLRPLFPCQSLSAAGARCSVASWHR